MPLTGKRKRAETKLVKAAVSRITKKARTIANKSKSTKKGSFGFKNQSKASKLGEWKFNDVESFTSDVGSASPQASQLCFIAAGTDVGNRIGRIINVRRITWYGRVLNQDTAGYTFGRILVVYDKQTNGAAATIDQVLRDPTPANSVGRPYAHINLNWRDRFVVLKNYFFGLNERGDTGAFKMFKGNWKGNLQTTYQNTGSTIADIASGAITVFYVSDKSTATAGYSTAFIWRVRYTDE